MSIRIVADSACELREPMVGIEYVTVELSVEKRSGLSACPAVGAWLRGFEGAETVFCLTLSSKLTGGFQSARIAKLEYEHRNPGRRVFLIDSKSAGPEMTLLVEKICELLRSGMRPEMVYRALTYYQKHTGLLFSLERVDRFVKSGRLSESVGQGVGVMGIRLLGRAKDGGTQVLGKCRGLRHNVDALLDQMDAIGYRGGKVIVAHNDAEDSAHTLVREIRNRFGSVDVRVERTSGLCALYADKGALLVGLEC